MSLFTPLGPGLGSTNGEIPDRSPESLGLEGVASEWSGAALGERLPLVPVPLRGDWEPPFLGERSLGPVALEGGVRDLRPWSRFSFLGEEREWRGRAEPVPPRSLSRLRDWELDSRCRGTADGPAGLAGVDCLPLIFFGEEGGVLFSLGVFWLVEDFLGESCSGVEAGMPDSL